MRNTTRLTFLVVFTLVLIIGCKVSNKDEFLFIESGREITIMSFSDKGNPDAALLVLPARINGLPVKTIGNGAFKYARTISVTIPDSVTTIGDYAFLQCRKMISVRIPDSVTTIGELAFSECKSLPSVTIPDSVTKIGDYAFSDSKSLSSVTISDSITTIGDYTFLRCKSLNSVTIPDSVTTIGELVFSDCTSLSSVTIPDSVTAIGFRAFSGCTSLNSVYMSNPTPPILGIEAFLHNNAGRQIYVPSGSVDSYKNAEGWSIYADDIVSQ